MSVLFSLIVAYFVGESLFVKQDVRCILFSRNISSLAGNTAMLFGIALVPLVYQQTIIGTVPFWASIFSLCLIGEKIGGVTIIAMLISFAGVLIVACSSYILNEDEEIDTNNHETYGIESVGVANLVGCSLMLVNAVLMALASVTTRMIQKQHWVIIQFWFSVIAIITMTIIYVCMSVPLGEINRIFDYSGE